MTFIISVTILTICLLCKSIKEYQEEKRRRQNYYRYLNPDISCPITSLLVTPQPTDSAVTVVKDKRQLVIFKNLLSKGSIIVYSRLFIYIDDYIEPEVQFVNDFGMVYYKLRLPVNYTGNISIPHGIALDLFVHCLKNSGITYVDNCERRILNEL